MPAAGNLGPRASVAYLRIGLVAFAVAVIAGVSMVSWNAPFAARLLLIAPFVLAWACLLDAAASTCGVRAVQGLRVTDRGLEPIADPRELERVRRRAKGLAVRVLVASAISVVPFLVVARP